MADQRAPMVLRPVHGWFHWWERAVMSAYRVAAVASAAAITALIVVPALRIHWLVASVSAAVLWILLAVVQEHDDRVVLDVDAEFLTLLRRDADPVLDRAGFAFRYASGPRRARPERYDTFLYEDPGIGKEECVDIWIQRDRCAGGQMEVSVDGNELSRLLVSLGEGQLADRVARTEDAVGDVAVLAAAFDLVLRGS